MRRLDLQRRVRRPVRMERTGTTGISTKASGGWQLLTEACYGGALFHQATGFRGRGSSGGGTVEEEAPRQHRGPVPPGAVCVDRDRRSVEMEHCLTWLCRPCNLLIDGVPIIHSARVWDRRLFHPASIFVEVLGWRIIPAVFSKVHPSASVSPSRPAGDIRRNEVLKLVLCGAMQARRCPIIHFNVGRMVRRACRLRARTHLPVRREA